MKPVLTFNGLLNRFTLTTHDVVPIETNREPSGLYFLDENGEWYWYNYLSKEIGAPIKDIIPFLKEAENEWKKDKLKNKL